MQARPDPTLPFNWTIRVYFEDTDAQGLVYFANYLKYGERARSEWLRQMDIESGRLAAQDNLALVVHRIEASYRAAARLDDQLRVESQLTRVQAARFICARIYGAMIVFFLRAKSRLRSWIVSVKSRYDYPTGCANALLP